MEFFESVKNSIKSLEDADLYKYGGAALAALFLILGLLMFVHTRKVNNYMHEIKNVETLRAQTRKILSDYRTVNEHKERVEEILAQDKNFRIGETYQLLAQKSGLAGRMEELSAPQKGETVSGKTELIVNSHFKSLTMKQLTELLTQIAAVPQLYAKELVIKKIPGAQLVDADIVVATLEPSNAE